MHFTGGELLMPALLEVKNLKKYFKTGAGWLHAVDGISFTIDEGKTLGVVGESGCGKTTLGRVILHLLEPTGGQIIVEGEDMTNPTKKELIAMREKMQIIFQDPYSSLNPRMSVSEIIMEPLVRQGRLTKAQMRAETARLMDVVGLAERFGNSYPHELDGGRRQRIGIARALALNPKFIVCDEPVSALDVSIQAQIINLLLDLQEERGLAYMFVTHDLSVVKYISDDIMVMYLGQMVEKASSDELFQNPLHPYTKALLSAIPIPSRCQYAAQECMEPQVLSEPIPNHFVACCRSNVINTINKEEKV
jgi:peptide/nickel transport system ATP-binding protein